MEKKAWVKVVEAFIALLLIASVLLIVIDKGYITKKDISPKVYEAELSILREVELDDNLREDILKINLPMNWENESFPKSVKDRINERTPSYLECVAKICEMDKICALDEYLNKDIYAQSVVISANLEIYSPRQLKLFCWRK
ncbi:hypothetical protein CMI39_01370 [Candidatus Pacearchaeota archaeon]|jgi:hypothetical protein|nr:hypothetical protein [Candidatus Pacearchaeota archaeon]|tara:strand:+ start:5339 stop:5764 length:426 start_codon:yes stop_codon:yes gene_type:complete